MFVCFFPFHELQPRPLPDHAGLQLLVAAGSVCDLGEQRKESLKPLDLQGQQRV